MAFHKRMQLSQFDGVVAKQQYNLLQVAIIIAMLFIFFQVYYTALLQQVSPAHHKGSISLLFASDDKNDFDMRYHVSVGRCLNEILTPRFNTKRAIMTSLVNFQHHDPEFVAALKLGVSLRENLPEYEWVDLVLLALYDDSRDTRAEVANAKMAGWHHVCFVEALVPTWQAYNNGESHQYMAYNAFGLTGYEKVLALPVASLVLQDPYYMLLHHEAQDAIQWGYPLGVVFACVPSNDSYNKASAMAVKSMGLHKGRLPPKYHFFQFAYHLSRVSRLTKCDDLRVQTMPPEVFVQIMPLFCHYTKLMCCSCR